MTTAKIHGEAIRSLRELCHFTREGLAMHAGLPGGGALIASIERGVTVPDPATAQALARALGVDLDALCAGDADAT